MSISDSSANSASSTHSTPTPSEDVLLVAYGEVCKSYHAVDDFRTKLLGILPIASLGGMLLLGKEGLLGSDYTMQRFAGFASFFAAAFTLALFLFEIRGILRCHHLIKRGAELENNLKVKGQFFVCSLQHDHASDSRVEKVFNAKVAASAVYSLVFASWMFLALKFTFGLTLIGCGLTASLIGGALAVGVYSIVNRRIAA